MTVCAYCNNDRKATREHITPDFIYKLLKQSGKHYSWNNNYDTYKLNVEAKIKDVCSTCNNDNLAKLDAYGKSFVEKNKLNKSIYLNNLVLTYDFHLLTRWLLKVSYNTARATKGSTPDLSQFTSYILDGKEKPNFKYIHVIVELLKPALEEKSDNTPPVHYFKIGNKLYTNPMFFGVTSYQSLKKNNSYKSTCIQIGSARFHLLFISQEYLIGRSALIKRQYMKNLKNSIILKQNQANCNIKTSDKTWIEHASTADTLDRVNQIKDELK